MNNGRERYEDDQTPDAWLGERDMTATADATSQDHDGLVMHVVIGLSAAAIVCVVLVQRIAALFL